MVFLAIVRLFVKQFIHLLSGDNNLVPFHLWLKKIVLKSEKVCVCFIQDCTWRELLVIHFAFESFSLHHRMQYLIWDTDNYATSLIMTLGSNESQLQNLIFADHKYKHIFT